MIKRLASLLLAACLLSTPALATSDRAGWIANATATNATATASKTGIANYQSVIYGVDASCATTPSSPLLVTIKDGSTTIFQSYVTAARTIDFPAGISIPPGDTVSATLAACGSGVVGSINLHGATR